MQQLNDKAGNQRGFQGGFGDDAVATSQGRAYLTTKNGQREVPGADTKKRPPRFPVQRIFRQLRLKEAQKLMM